MKITVDRNMDGIRVTVERDPPPPERFAAVCKLLGAVIGGTVLLGAIALVGKWAIGGALVALVAVGLYKIGKEI